MIAIHRFNEGAILRLQQCRTCMPPQSHSENGFEVRLEQEGWVEVRGARARVYCLSSPHARWDAGQHGASITTAHGWPSHVPIARCLELVFHVVMFVLEHEVLVLMAHLGLG